MRTAPGGLAQAPCRLERLIADRGCHADRLRADLKAGGTTLLIPGTRSHKRPIPCDRGRDRDRWPIEAAFSPLKHLRRVTTRSDKLAADDDLDLDLDAIMAR